MFARPNPYDLLPLLPVITLASDDVANNATLGMDQQSSIFGGAGRFGSVRVSECLLRPAHI